MPVAIAKMVRPAGEWICSLAAMLRRCVIIVLTETFISAAISLLASPLTMPSITSFSRGERSLPRDVSSRSDGWRSCLIFSLSASAGS